MMTQQDRHMVLSLLTPGPGHHLSAWRHPKAPVGADLNFQYYASVAQMAEREVYDMLFLADSLALPFNLESRYPLHFPPFEPLTLLSALAAVTSRLGLAGSISTTYTAPFTVARMVASLDQLSAGRAAWNVVTSMFDNEARNFGAEGHLLHQHRYRRAREYVDVVKALWDSWEDDAIIGDKAGARAFDQSKIHEIDHKGEFFSVAGPLNLPRPPQGHPVIVQAGASGPGQDLSAAVADVVFTAQNDLASAQDFYRGLKGRMATFGRSPDELRVLPGLMPIVGRTKAEAQAKFDALQELVGDEEVLGMLSKLMGDVDLTGVDLDGPLPDDLPESNATKSRADMFHTMSQKDHLTVRQLCQIMAGARGHYLLVDSAEAIANEMELWFREGGADGFNLMPALMPSDLEDFNTLVLPILRQRGVVKTAYIGHTLRENLGLARPERTSTSPAKAPSSTPSMAHA
jgi:FMN-dependent oxidoreductase (nitrilotriacetate monooxygenase family)